MEIKYSIALAALDSLPRGWEMRRLDDVAFVNKSTSNLKELDWINYTDIASVGSRIVEKPIRLRAKEAPSRARRVLSAGDTVISTVRPNRRIFFQFNADWENPIASTGFAVVTPKHIDDADFLNAVLTSDKAVQLYESFCDSGAYPSFNASRLNDVAIPWPPNEIRSKIGQILRTFQAKIEVNRQILATLDDFSKVLYDSWFANFNFLNGKTAKIPNGEVASKANGTLPEGWTVGTLSDVAEISKASLNPLKFPETIFRHYSIPAFDESQFPQSVLGAQILSTKFRVETPCVLVSKLNPRTPRVWTVPTISPDSICSTEFIVLKPKNKELLPFLDCVVRNSNFQEQFASFATGSTGSRQRVRPEDIFQVPVVIPDEEGLARFSALLAPSVSLAGNLREQNSTLGEVRDALLPRLVFGEINLSIEDLVSS